MSLSIPKYDDVAEGDELPPLSIQLTRADLVKYAGASGDFNIIHWNERVATSVGLPNVIAHGMLTMGQAVNVVSSWVGDPGRVVEYGVRFAKPVPVPDDDEGATVVVTAKIGKKLDDKQVRVDIDARCGDEKVLSMARATVALD